MSLSDHDVKREYRSLHGDVVRDFYTPLLNEAVLYRRSVGFFSSSSLVSLTDGLRGLLQNCGRVELVASPCLSAEDIDAINDGFDRRDAIIAEALLRELKEPKGKFEAARLNLLSNLIAAGVLMIKIAVLEENDEVGMFHEKVGLIYDADGNIVAFSGSMNETANAYFKNYESIDVYTSWGHDVDRVYDKQSAFNAMWDDYEPGLRVVDFPEISKAIISKYQRTPSIDYDDFDVMPDQLPLAKSITGDNVPRVPSFVKMRDYQLAAIDSWERERFRGIFDMATGTGKTFTALAAVAHLSQKLNDNLAVVIVCPYQHLVEQWKEDIVSFGMKPIVCYSASSQRNWRERVRNSVSGFKIGAISCFCLVTTNATFSTEFMQSQISKLRGNCLIVADEAHNFGAFNLARALPQRFPFRLALSATIERHGDEEGTARLYDYFGKKCIEYSLEDAINNGMLTPYYYHPVVVSLEGDELEQYIDISRQVSKMIASSGKDGKVELSESAKLMLIKRARIVAGARAKLPALKQTIEPFSSDNHMLVYCGATTLHDSGYAEGDPTYEEVRQVDLVTETLGEGLGMKVSQFTSQENAERREILKKEFSDGKQMQALIAIRCLDEGVNIPSIEKAFILASSTNPKEYIQRRGRVLRLSPGKECAVIYDFITLPMQLEEIGGYPDEDINSSKSLAAREVVRMKDFASISENPSEALGLAYEITEAFGITPEDEEGLYV